MFLSKPGTKEHSWQLIFFVTDWPGRFSGRQHLSRRSMPSSSLGHLFVFFCFPTLQEDVGHDRPEQQTYDNFQFGGSSQRGV
jgi:hypothetical protein